MQTYQFSEREQEQFWNLNKEHYKSDIVAGLIVNWAKKYFGRAILDVGAGSGALIREIRSKIPFVEISGLDIAPKSQDILKGSCTKIPFPDASFDTLCMTDVIEHLSDADLAKALSEMTRVLRSSGHLIITTINQENLAQTHVGCPSCGAIFHRWGHCQVFSIERFETIASKYGYEIVRHKTTNLGRMQKFPIISRLIYLTGADRLMPERKWHDDLMVVLKKK